MANTAGFDARPKAERWACPTGNKWNVGDELFPDPFQIRLRRMSAGLLAGAHHVEEWVRASGLRRRVAFVTTTYAPGEEYSPRDISRLIRHYRQWCKRRGFKLLGVWKLELQERGAPHYHLMLWLPYGITPPLPDKQGWWKKGSSNASWSGFSARRQGGRRVRRPVAYLAKYLAKHQEGELPPGARLWGLIGAPPVARVAASFACAPGWLRQLALAGQDLGRWPVVAVRKIGSWWHVLETGMRYRSPWEFMQAFGGGAALRYRGFTEWDIEGPLVGGALP